MPTLIVENGYSITMPGVGSRKPFGRLSEKRITKAVGAALRRQFGSTSVAVSGDVRFSGNSWRGSCVVFGRPWPYRVLQ